jgi:type IV secretory pathway TrbD component
VPSPTLDHHHKVHKAIFRPLTLCGVDRRLFFLAMLLGAATFNLFYSLLAGCLVFALIYGLARTSVAIDPQILPIALRSVSSRPRYDACRWSDSTPRVARTRTRTSEPNQHPNPEPANPTPEPPSPRTPNRRAKES